MRGTVTYDFDGTNPIYYKVQNLDRYGRWHDNKEEFYMESDAREFAKTLGRTMRARTRVVRFEPDN